MLHYTAIFRKVLATNVLYFDIRAIEDKTSTSILVGSVVVNADPNRKIKSFIQGNDDICPYKQMLVKQCEEMAKSIIEVMQPEI